MDTSATREIHTTERPRGGPALSVASTVAGIVGVVLLVIGIVALVRAGLVDLTEPAVAVGPFSRTALFGLIEIVLGLLALTTAASRSVNAAAVLAVITGVAGIVWVIEPAAFSGVLGVTGATAWLYVIVAGALLAGVAVDRRGQVV